MLSVKESGNVASKTKRKCDGMGMEEEEVYLKRATNKRELNSKCQLSVSRGSMNEDEEGRTDVRGRKEEAGLQQEAHRLAPSTSLEAIATKRPLAGPSCHRGSPSCHLTGRPGASKYKDQDGRSEDGLPLSSDTGDRVCQYQPCTALQPSESRHSGGIDTGSGDDPDKATRIRP